MNIKDTKISRHENPDLVKVEFVGDEDTVMICMHGEGVNDLSDEQAVGRARSVMSSCLNEKDRNDSSLSGAGVDQTFSQP
jgi:DNA relaxase NicK